LYMAVSRTLLRTYAVEFHSQPELAFRAANSRILADTHVDLFVTVFYGVLDPVAGRFTYCNAGHSPPYLFRANGDDAVEALDRTGLPLGVFGDLTWEQKTVQIAPGDLLVLYTDGITDAEDGDGRFFGHERLRWITRRNVGRSAQEVQDALMNEVHQFIGDTSQVQHDDIALVVVARTAPE
jgi:sigma-B regulation protein RsbU (phosphoserine phosphatase)